MKVSNFCYFASFLLSWNNVFFEKFPEGGKDEKLIFSNKNLAFRSKGEQGRHLSQLNLDYMMKKGMLDENHHLSSN